MKYSPEALKIVPSVYAAAEINMKSLDDLFSGKVLPKISKEVKEKEVFTEIILCYGVISEPEKIINYLVFDYKINEKFIENFNPLLEIVKTVQELLKVRKAEQLYLEINDQLNTNDSNISKKPKV